MQGRDSQDTHQTLTEGDHLASPSDDILAVREKARQYTLGIGPPITSKYEELERFLNNGGLERLRDRARRLTRDEADADDLVQDTCLLALQYHGDEHELQGRYDSARGAYETWLYQLMQRAWLDHWRAERALRRGGRAAKVSLSDLKNVDLLGVPPEQVLVEIDHDFRSVIEGFGPIDQLIALSVLRDGYTLREMPSVLRVHGYDIADSSYPYVGRRLRRIVAALKAALGGYSNNNFNLHPARHRRDWSAWDEAEAITDDFEGEKTAA